MPEDQVPETPSTVVEAPSAEATPSPSADDVYDQAYEETMVEDAPEASPQAQVEQQAQSPTQVDQNKSYLTQGQLSVLGRAKIDPAMLTNMDPAGVSLFVEQLRQSQSALDTMGAQLARFQSQDQVAQQPQPQQQPKPNSQPTPFKDRLKELTPKLIEAYDPEIEPLIGLIGELEDRLSSSSQSQAAVEPMAQLLTDMVLDSAMDSFVKDYPSLSKPEARAKATERFWTEWSTGAYAKQGVPLRQQIREAVENSVKTTFLNTNEHTAAASLVQQNKARVASQPKIGSTEGRPKPRTMDDVYDDAFNATMAPELSTR